MYVIAAFFLLCMAGYAAFLLRAAWFFARIAPCHPASVSPFVSVIIPARNEAAQVETCLRAVLAQNYPQDRFEVILVNDHSTDTTGDIARRIAAASTALTVVDLQTDGINSYKKAAISAGIEQARGEIILQTDADCWMGTGWIAAMAACFQADVALVSGPIEIVSGNSLFSRFQSLESMGLVAIGAGSLAAGHPNMCNGANLAYLKQAFEEVGGFSGVDGVASGDDELLLQKLHVRNQYKLRFAKSREAIVRTNPMERWRDFRQQRLRWVSKARFYPNRWVNAVQALAYLAFLGVPILIGMACFDPAALPFLLGVLTLKLLADISILYQSAGFFHNLQLLRYLLPLQPLYLLYVLWIGIAGNLIATYTWKGRSVK